MKKHEILDMTKGPFFKKIMYFSVPLMLTGVLQLIYNAADLIVVGQYSGKECLAAVGSTGALINLIVNMFIGLSTGAGVVVAHSIGEKNPEKTSRSVHTAAALSIISSVVVCIVGVLFSHKFLEWMATPEDVIDLSSIYLKIVFLGAPGALIFNFGASILRATGDTKRPLYFLSFSGIINVILNLIFVIGFNMSVDGVAIATTVAQYISAFLIVSRILKLENECKIHVSKIRLHKEELKEILKIGLPAGLQGSLFSISNVLIQSTVNSFGSVAMAGNTAASNIESIVFIAINAISQTAMTFTSQNMGAKKYKNLRKVYLICTASELVIGVVLSAVILLFPREILSVFNSDPAVIEAGRERLIVMMSTYFICSLMDVTGYQIRGMGKSVEPMLITLLGVCGIRILWIYTILPLNRTIETLFISYPVSWFITAVALIICYFIHERKLLKASQNNE